MTQQDHILFQTASGWSLESVDGGFDIPLNDATDQVVAERVAESVKSRRLLIGLHSSKVVSDYFDCETADVRNRDALGFQFETTLPYPAEKLTCDFRKVDGGMFGVGTLTEPLQTVIDDLERQGVQVHSVSPTAILGIQQLVRREKLTDAIVVWFEEWQIHLFVLKGGTIGQWLQLPNQASPLRSRLKILLQRNSLESDSLVFVNANSQQVKLALEFVNVRHVKVNSLKAEAGTTAKQILSCRTDAWFELRRNRLAMADPIRSIRRPLQWAMFAAGLFLLAITIGFWLRSRSYDSQVTSLRQQEARLFKQIFPNAKPPAGVLSRLRSEHARLSGASGAKRSENVPLPFPALTVLDKFLNGLPKDERLEVSSLQITDGEIQVDTNLRSHGSAGIVVSSLESQGFSVVPPASEKRDNRSVNSLIVGSIQNEKEQP